MSSLVKNKNMSNLTWFGVGGFSKYYFQPSSEKDLVSFLKNNNLNLPIYPLGAGSNIIIRDLGFNGVVIKLSKKFNLSFLRAARALRAALTAAVRQQGSANLQLPAEAVDLSRSVLQVWLPCQPSVAVD